MIAKNIAKSERIRLAGVANRAKNAVPQSPPSATPSHPAHALPVLKSSKSLGSFPDDLSHGCINCHALHNAVNNAVSSVNPLIGVNGSNSVVSSRNSGSSTFINYMSNNAN